MTFISATFYEPDGVTVIDSLSELLDVRFQDELNTAGSFSFSVSIASAIQDNALDKYNIVKLAFNGGNVFYAGQIERSDKTLVSDAEQAGQTINVVGRGLLSLLEQATVWPEYGIRSYTGTTRSFSFASKDGSWRVISDWQAPASAAYNSAGAPAARKNQPANWPDPAARWIWSSDPNSDSAPGRNWFRSTFTVNSDSNIVIYATCDDRMLVYLDGSPVLASAGSAPFKKVYSFPTSVAAGTHTIAAWVDNLSNKSSANPTGYNPAGFLCSVYSSDVNGNRISNILRSSSSSFIVKAYGTTPGWIGPTILSTLLFEAQNRNVRSLLALTPTYSNTVDSDGNIWTTARQDRSITLFETDMSRVLSEIAELDADFYIDPDLGLNAYLKRGTDRSSSVILLDNEHTTSHTSSEDGTKLRNHGVISSNYGFVEISSPSSEQAYGRRETGISVGTANSSSQAKNVGIAALKELASFETTDPFSYTSAAGPQPYIDFWVGDTITYPGPDRATFKKGRVMSITGSLSENIISWDLEIYPDNDTVTDIVVITADDSTTASPSDLYRQEVLSDSPWGYWRQSESAGTTLFDSSGNKRNLQIITSTSGYTLNQDGPVDRAIYWNGGTASARSSSTFAYQYATLEAWVNIGANPAADTSILAMAVSSTPGASGQFDKDLYVHTDGKMYFYVYKSSTETATIVSPSALPFNTWNHVVVTVGPSGTFMYINKNLVAQNTTVKHSFPTGQFVFSRGGPSSLNGKGAVKIAEPAVYYQQLTSSRVASHYTAASTIF